MHGAHLVVFWFAALTHLKFIPPGKGSPGWTRTLEMGATAAGYFVMLATFLGASVPLRSAHSLPWGLPYAVFEAIRDPGAAWILAFAALFTAANALHLLPARRVDA